MKTQVKIQKTTAGNYTVFTIPKRDGSKRYIEAPDPGLKKKQYDLLNQLKGRMMISPFAHAFQPYKNIATMAAGHVGKEWVGCIDIKDFFPSIKLQNVWRYMGGLNSYEIKNFECAFHDFGDKKGSRLPQGAPTSPLISNAYMHKIDWELAWKAAEMGCTYSRYADDLVFSGDAKGKIKTLFAIAEGALQYQHLTINKKKTKLMHKSRRQLVCGVVVNEKLNISRKLRKNLRAEIHQQKGGQLSNQTRGRIAFHEMIRENKKDFTPSEQMISVVKLSRVLDDPSRIKY